MHETEALATLAAAMGVSTHYVDGLQRPVTVGPETLVRVCASLGAEIDGPSDAIDALRRYGEADRNRLPEVLVAWDGALQPVALEDRYRSDTGRSPGATDAVLTLEDGSEVAIEVVASQLCLGERLPPGFHRLRVVTAGLTEEATVISAPVQAHRREGGHRSWGVGTQLAALRSRRSRSVADLRDLESVCRWVGDRGGDLVTVLPLLPTFNVAPAEASPYSPVSRLFWSELVLDLGEAHRSVHDAITTLDVMRANLEVRAALADLAVPDGALADEELVRYARFRGAQTRLGRNWRDWPREARDGRLTDDWVDAEEERFHLVAQTMARRQLGDLRKRLDRDGLRLGLDLAVGVHPDGYDPWSRQSLFAGGMSVGAPPDGGFPSGQDWGFSPVLPAASRAEGHRYLAASIAHQAALSGVLRVDHIMAWSRLYWIPHGLGLHEGTYVSYPAEELFAVLTLESHRNRCEVVGENLGTVPPEIGEALPRHRIWGMFLAEFEAGSPHPSPPGEADVALIGTHDTPTLAGWVAGIDIGERVRSGLLDEEAAPAERQARAEAARRLAETLGGSLDDLPDLLDRLLGWMGSSDTPLVVPWLEDLWLEVEQVNLPGTRSSERPNWQRPMSRLLDDALADPEVDARARRLQAARSTDPTSTD